MKQEQKLAWEALVYDTDVVSDDVNDKHDMHEPGISGRVRRGIGIGRGRGRERREREIERERKGERERERDGFESSNLRYRPP